MLYASYKMKIEKRMLVLATLKKFKWLLIGIAAFCLAITSAFLCTKGIIYGENEDFSPTLTYGQEVNYSANALFSDIYYEYRQVGTESWSTEKPTLVGEYEVRSVAQRAFGIASYSECKKFTISPKKTELAIVENSLKYGEKPNLEAALSFDDKIEDSFAFEYGELKGFSTTLKVIDDSVSILNSNGDNVTNQYEFTTKAHPITLTPRQITFKSSDKTFVYNDEQFDFEDYSTTNGSLFEGDTANLTFNNSITNVGSIENAYSVAIANKKGEDVTHLYKITSEIGELIVTKRQINIETKSTEWVYDGREHSLEEFTLSEDTPLCEGHTLKVVKSTLVLNVGTYENNLEFGVFDSDDNDVTKNYNLQVTYGTLTVTPRKIAIQTASDEWVYDGKEHSLEEFTLSEDTPLCDGHILKVVKNTSALNVGVYENNLEVGIYLGEENVTANYQITYLYGTLSITPRLITVETKTHEWMYDGKEHYDIYYSFASETQIADNQTSVASDKYPTIKNVGTCENKFAIEIYSGDEIVTANYQITYLYGTLSITSRPITIETETHEWMYDGIEHYDIKYKVTSKTKIAPNQTSEQKGEYPTIKNVGVNENKFAIEIYSGEEIVTANYTITYLYGTLYITPRPITIETATNEWMYDGIEHYDITYKVTSKVQIADSQTSSQKGEYPTIKNVGVKENKFAIEIYAGVEVVTENYTITYVYGTLSITPRPITVETATHEWMYDGEKHYDISYSFASEIQLAPNQTSVASDKYPTIKNVGSCKNKFAIEIYAGEENVTKNYTITYVYGTLSITPRPITVETATHEWMYDGKEHYDISYKVVSEIQIVPSQTSKASNKYSTIKNVGACENIFAVVIYAGEENVTKNYTITYLYGTLSITQRPITIETATNAWMYDGKEHYDISYKVVSEIQIVPNQTSMASDEYATIKNVGTCENKFAIEIYAGEENVTANYQITYIYGTLSITLRPITVETETHEWMYDGEQHSDTRFKVTSETQIADNQFGSQNGEYPTIKNVGSCENKFVIDIYAGEEVVTSNYQITYLYGTLSITLRPITIETETNEWMYDGEQHSDTRFKVTSEIQIAPNQTGKVSEGYPTIKNVGTCENKFAIEIYAGEEVVTSNYTITYLYGTLSITSRPITIKTATKKWIYDGEEHSDTGFKVASEIQIADNQFGSQTGEYPTIKNVGSCENKFAIEIYAGEEVVTSNYTITYIYGTLSITQRPITVVTKSAEKVYNGKPLTYNEYYSVPENSQEGGLVAGHNLLVSVMGTITDVGVESNIVDESQTAIIIEETKEDVTQNYLITYNLGNLTVKPRPITVSTGSSTKVYDSIILENHSYQIISELSPALVEGQSEVVEFSASILDAGSVKNEISFAIIDTAEGDDKTSNYNITYDIGNLEITPIIIYYSSESASKVFDGEPIFAPISYDANILPSHSINKVEFTTFSQPDKKENIVESYEIVDEQGNIIPNKNYKFEPISLGTLEILPIKITVVTGSGEKYYDGTPLIVTDYYFEEGTLAQGHVIQDIKFYDKAIEPGVYNNELSFKIYKENEDVTYGYEIQEKWGTLIIDQDPSLLDKLKLEVKPKDVEKVYDGTPLYPKNELEETPAVKELLDKGYKFKVKVTGSQTDVGSSPSLISEFKLFNALGEDVSDNVDVSFKEGKITVTKHKIYIHLYDIVKMYDGKPVSFKKDDYWVENLPEGCTLEFELFGSLTITGQFGKDELIKSLNEDPDKVPPIVKDALGIDVTDKYEIIFEGKGIVITRRSITVRSKSAEKEYDGEPLSSPEVWVSLGKLADGHTIKVVSSSQIVEVGEIENNVVIEIYDENGKDVTGYYEIVNKNGTLNIY